jgi:hypothetical protein
VWYCGTGDECRKCFAESIEYWEERGGFSSEGLFDSLNACRLPREDSRLYRVIMGAYFNAIRGKRSEPCEECGAVMTYDYTVDEWSHEDTPTAGQCYTAFRWGVK